jgi:hypothetical protein
MPVYQFIYCSRATTPMTDEDLVTLLHSCRSFNEAHAISGILLYGYHHFIQLLEGDKEVVRHLYFDRIMKDPRHHKCKILTETDNAERRFDHWGMSFKRLNTEEQYYFAGYIDPDLETEYGRDLLAPLRIMDAISMIAPES